MIRALLALALSATQAAAHEFYSPMCCSDRDCAPLPVGAVKPVADGWQLIDGRTVPYGDKRVQFSPDGRFHGCFRLGDPKAELLCLYVPSSGS